MRHEPVTPFVVVVSELRIPGSGLPEASQRMESEFAIPHRRGGCVRPPQGAYLSRIAEVHHIEPVVQSEPRIADAGFHIRDGESGVQGFADIGLMVPVSVLEEKDVRGRRDDQPALPRSNPLDCQEPLGEDGMPVNHAVGVGVFQVLDPAQGLLARRRIVRIVEQFGDKDTS